jgi:hypothetical protein
VRIPTGALAITLALALLTPPALIAKSRETSPPIAPARSGAPLDEMLIGASGRIDRWTSSPQLVIEMQVLLFDSSSNDTFAATSEQLTDDEASALEADLTEALVLFSGGRFTRFSAVERESVQPGAQVRTVRTGQIVVGRFSGLRTAIKSIGLGGRSARSTGSIRAGSVMLDADYDRLDSRRQLLRIHELGHALGFNHVTSRVSIMNPQLGPQPTATDREAVRLAAGVS